MLTEDWSPDSWRQKPAKQQPQYEDRQKLQHIIGKIRNLPPLVFAGEIDRLRGGLAKASCGEAFILQGGDCAERFQDCNGSKITRKLKILLQMSVVLSYSSRKPVIRIGRIAGQYAKPRSSDTEIIDGEEIPSFRGDIINSINPTLESRKPDPDRLLRGYKTSALTLNYIRALTRGGFADLHHPEHWDLDFVQNTAERKRYKEIVSQIQDAIAFMESIGNINNNLNWVDFYTSHEGLHLPYEEAQTRFIKQKGGFYNLSAHMLWIGDRTRDLNGAHIEYFRGIRNPLGLKVGPSANPKEIIEVIKALNPKNEEGRITLITRFGHDKVDAGLPKIVAAVQEAQQHVVWSVDPMHGNAIKTSDNVKTRSFDHILAELTKTITVHRQSHTHLGGVHFELTGDNVTECIGGSQGLGPEDLSKNYETYCDPRLNYSQSLEMSFLISNLIK